MKLGNFVVVVLCLSLFLSHAGADDDPAELVRSAHAYRRAGNPEQALAHFCRYMYVDAAGPLADEASANARALAAKLGYPSDSDHAACSGRPRASQPDPVATVATPLPKPPQITKREIVGLSLVGGSVASLGLALLEGGTLKDIGEDIQTTPPGSSLDALEARRDRASLRQKLFLIGGGVTLITGGILYVTGRNDRKRAERAYVAPSLVKGGGGVVLGGRF
jgi:hypothetical protein